jgi:hypothetical protein
MVASMMMFDTGRAMNAIAVQRYRLYISLLPLRY